MSSPLRRRGLKSYCIYSNKRHCKSSPLRRRGLKSKMESLKLTEEQRRLPCGDVDWNGDNLERTNDIYCRLPCGDVDWNSVNRPSFLNDYMSSPLRRRGLKSITAVPIIAVTIVVSLAETWIEILMPDLIELFPSTSSPLRRRGLKFLYECAVTFYYWSSPLRRRGLKYLNHL